MSKRPAMRWSRLAFSVGLVAVLGCQPESGGIVVSGIEFSGPPGSLAPHLAVAEDRPVLSWLEPAGDGRHALRVAVREPGGTWRTVGTVTAGDALFVNWADIPSVLPLDGGTWIAHWLQKVAAGTYAYHVMTAVSTDGGATWTPGTRIHEDTSETEHGFLSLVPWNGGAAGIWLDGRAMTADGPMTLQFTTVTPGNTAAPDTELDARVCECCQTALAVTSRGLVAAYRDRSEAEIRDVAVQRFEDGRWSDPVIVGNDNWHYPGCPVNGPALAARGDTVALAWFTAADNQPRVWAAISADGGATFGPPVQVDDGRPAGRVDVAWWGETALVSWIEETDEAGDVRVRELGADGRLSPGVMVAATEASRAAGFPRLAVAGDTAFLAWTVPGDSGGVRVAALARAP